MSWNEGRPWSPPPWLTFLGLALPGVGLAWWDARLPVAGPLLIAAVVGVGVLIFWKRE